MNHLSPAARAAPLHGLLSVALLHTLAAAQNSGAKTTPTFALAATDLDTGQPSMLDLTAKAHVDKQHARRDSAGPPAGSRTHKWRTVDGTDKAAKNGGYHQRREALLN